jgi:hypothetical protein
MTAAMNSGAQRWRRVEELCHQALARDAADRPAFVQNASDGDEELRREVDSLLAKTSRVEGFLESATFASVKA